MPSPLDVFESGLEKKAIEAAEELKNTIDQSNGSHVSVPIETLKQLVGGSDDSLYSLYSHKTGELQNLRDKTGLCSMTGLYRGKQIYAKFKDLMLEVYRKKSPKTFTFVYLDADDFSKGNTEYGHFFMDSVLKNIGDVINDNIRAKNDLGIRPGGEELGCVLSTSLSAATKKAETIRKQIAAQKYHNGHRQTVSIGLYTFKISPDDFNEVEHLMDSYAHMLEACNKPSEYREHAIKREEELTEIFKQWFGNISNKADDATYEAKLQGKNRICVYDPDKDYSAIRADYAIKQKQNGPVKA